jgi:hypothetical protein
MFRLNWPSSDVQDVMIKDSAAHCNAVFFPRILAAAVYFGYIGHHQFYFGCPCVARGCFWFCLVC